MQKLGSEMLACNNPSESINLGIDFWVWLILQTENKNNPHIVGEYRLAACSEK